MLTLLRGRAWPAVLVIHDVHWADSATLDPGESVYLDALLSATARSTLGPSVALPMLCAGRALLAGLVRRRQPVRQRRA